MYSFVKAGIVFVLITLFVHFLPSPISADVINGIAGQSCGVASGETAEMRQCCYSEPTNLPASKQIALLARVAKIVGWIPSATDPLGPFGPGLTTPVEKIAETYVGLNDKLLNFQEKSNTKLPCIEGEPYGDPKTKNCTCQFPPELQNYSASIKSNTIKLCESYLVPDNHSTDSDKKKITEELESCKACVTEINGYYSSFGCIPFKVEGFVNWFVSLSIAIAGIVSLYCLIMNSIRMQLSRGDASAIEKARQNIISCVLGVLLIIFSVFILRIAGISLFVGLSIG